MLVDITELKRTERETKAARDYAEAIIRTARDAMVVLHADLRVKTANEAFYKTFKTTPDQTEGHLIYDLGNQQWNIPKLRILLEDILPRNSFFNDFEVTQDFPQIGRRTMLLNARRLELDDGALQMVLLAIEDVTERQRADELGAHLGNSIPPSLRGGPRSACCTLDIRQPQKSPMLTRSCAEPAGLHARGVAGQGTVADRSAQGSSASEPRCSFGNCSKRGEIRYERFARKRIRVVDMVAKSESRGQSSTRKDAQGQVIGATQHRRDITKRKQAEEALRASEERYRTLFDFDPVAIYSCDASGVIQQFNRRAAELWGREPASGDTDERFCGSFKLFRPDGSFMPHEQCPMAEVIAGKIPAAHDAEVLIERPDGSRITVVVNIRPLKTARGEITGAINCFYDITQRKQAEEALAQAHAELQSHAEELTRFNRAAVGRELRMIELKKEINELCQRHGQPARYPLEFRGGGKGERWLNNRIPKMILRPRSPTTALCRWNRSCAPRN